MRRDIAIIEMDTVTEASSYADVAIFLFLTLRIVYVICSLRESNASHRLILNIGAQLIMMHIIMCMQEVRFLFSEMGFVKGLLLKICTEVGTTQLLQCILFQMNQTLPSGSTLVPRLKAFQVTLEDVQSRSL